MRRLGLLLLPALGILACGCSSADPGPELQFGELVEVLGERVPGASLLGAEGAAFLVGEGSLADALLAARAAWRPQEPEEPLRTIFDVSRMDALERAALSDRLVEPALEGPGPLLLDEAGATSAALRQGRAGMHLVRVGADRRIRDARELPR